MEPLQKCCLLIIVGVLQAAAASPPVEPPTLNATCPSVEPKDRPVCPNECSSDDDCQHNRICCTNECGGRTCSDSVEFCKSLQCDVPFCGKGVQEIYSPFSCCPFCPPSRNDTCPSVTPTSDDNCPDECVTDDHCPSNMICCANGCGGHVCSHSNEFCKSIACDEPFCGEGVLPVTSPFRCCPFCPPSCEIIGDIKRKGRNVITTFSTEHPDATFQCKYRRSQGFHSCTSPLKFRTRRGVRRVMVRAQCAGVATSKQFTIRVR